MPTVYGSESADEKDARGGAGVGTRWTPADVDPWLRERDVELADAVIAFTEDLARSGLHIQGGGAGAHPSFSIWGTAASGVEIAPFSVYCGSPASLSCNFQWTSGAGETSLSRFLDDLVAAGAPLKPEVIRDATYKRRPGIHLDLLKDPARRAAIAAATQRLTQGAPTA